MGVSSNDVDLPVESASHQPNLTVITLDNEVIQQAVQSEWNDLEDAIHYYYAVYNGCSYLITRNVDDLFPAPDKTKVITPAEFPSVFKKNGS